MNKTAIIIGGGLGGLFTGAILAKEGLRVTVLEKNATAGGGLQTFRWKYTSHLPVFGHHGQSGTDGCGR